MLQAQAVRVRGRGRHLDFVVDDRAPFSQVEGELRTLLERMRHRLPGGVVTVEVGRRLLATEEMARLKAILEGEYGVKVAEVWSQGHTITEALSHLTQLPVSLALPPRQAPPPDLPTGENTLLVRGTCRSGTALFHHGDVVVLGDVNPGAEVCATGDILVFGVLRGMAHAGAKGNDQAVIVALSIQPVQLRIGPYLGMGNPQDGHPAEGTGPEIAYVSGGGIVVEPYTPLFHRL